MATNKKQGGVWGVALAVLFCMAVLFACACELEPRDNFIPQDVDEGGIKYIRVPYTQNEIWQQEYFIIKTQERRDAFLEQTKSHYDESEVAATPFKILTSELNMYDDEFFNNWNMIVIQKIESSGSHRHKVEKISLNNNTLSIRIRRRIPGKGEFGTADMAYWFIFIPVKKDYFDGENVIIEYRDTTRG